VDISKFVRILSLYPVFLHNHFCTVGRKIMSGEITWGPNLQLSKQRLTLILYIISWPLVPGTCQRHLSYSSDASVSDIFFEMVSSKHPISSAQGSMRSVSCHPHPRIHASSHRPPDRQVFLYSDPGYSLSGDLMAQSWRHETRMSVCCPWGLSSFRPHI